MASIMEKICRKLCAAFQAEFRQKSPVYKKKETCICEKRPILGAAFQAEFRQKSPVRKTGDF